MTDQIINTQLLAENWCAEELLNWAFDEFQQEVAIASSFGAEDVVLIDIVSRLQNPFAVFTLDTDFLFPQTYQLIEQVEQRYGIRVEKLRSALTPNEQADHYGEALWGREPDRCCRLRKVEPHKRKLAGLRAWITGVRRDQSPTRLHTRKLEWDEKFGLFKLNPLVDWSSQQVWDYIRANDVPYNPLHDQNYPSIGCTHCTRPVVPGEDSRAGRWSAFAKTECGLHGRGGQ